MNRTILLALATIVTCAGPSAAHFGPNVAERTVDHRELRQDRRESRDDTTDLARFESFLDRFERAWDRRDRASLRALDREVAGALAAEVGEGRLEQARDGAEARRSDRELRSSHRAEAEMRHERQRIATEYRQLLGRVDETSLTRKHALLVDLVALGRAEQRGNRRETREDRRELREDRRETREDVRQRRNP